MNSTRLRPARATVADVTNSDVDAGDLTRGKVRDCWDILAVPMQGYPAGTVFASRASTVTFVGAIGDH